MSLAIQDLQNVGHLKRFVSDVMKARNAQLYDINESERAFQSTFEKAKR